MLSYVRTFVHNTTSTLIACISTTTTTTTTTTTNNNNQRESGTKISRAANMTRVSHWTVGVHVVVEYVCRLAESK